MKSVNKIILLGHVGKDPETKLMQSGVQLTTFSLATSEKWKSDDGEQHEKTEWHNIVCWRKTAEIVAKYVKKGSPLYVEGKVTYEKYEKDGVTKYATKIVANDIGLLGTKEPQVDNGGEQAPEPEQESAAAPDNTTAEQKNDLLF